MPLHVDVNPDAKSERETSRAFSERICSWIGRVTQLDPLHDHAYPRWLIEARTDFERTLTEALPLIVPAAEFRELVASALFPGRRIRPSLFYALWRLRHGEFPRNAESVPAIALELFHAASIVVDDLIDGEERRRNKTPLYRIFGAGHAALASHYLVALGQYLLLHRSAMPALLAAWSSEYSQAVVGELHDVQRRTSLSIEEQYRRSLAKTSAFFAFIGHAITVSAEPLASHQGVTDDLAAALRLTGAFFQAGNDIIDLLFLEESGRYSPTHTYELHLTFLLPSLIHAGLVHVDEINSQVSYERLVEISKSARSLVDGDAIACFSRLGPMLTEFNCLRLAPDERQLLSDMIDNSFEPSFWLHPHD